MLKANTVNVNSVLICILLVEFVVLIRVEARPKLLNIRRVVVHDVTTPGPMGMSESEFFRKLDQRKDPNFGPPTKGWNPEWIKGLESPSVGDGVNRATQGWKLGWTSGFGQESNATSIYDYDRAIRRAQEGTLTNLWTGENTSPGKAPIFTEPISRSY